jgi:1-acyl-sn-glycerol-3-phosphate acyltransferase
LLPFKAGAFHTAFAAGVPVVPVLASCQSHINLNRWDNGVVIIEMMAPVPTAGLDKADVKAFSAQIHASMSEKFAEINREAATLMGKTLTDDDV